MTPYHLFIVAIIMIIYSNMCNYSDVKSFPFFIRFQIDIVLFMYKQINLNLMLNAVTPPSSNHQHCYQITARALSWADCSLNAIGQ